MPREALGHPTPSELQAFRDARLADAEARALDSHLAVCPACQAALDALAEDDLVRRCRQAGPADSSVPDQPAETGALPPSAAAPPAIPTDLANHPRYQILELLGVGGMGAVFKAQHKLLKHHVALKIVGSQLLDNPTAVQRFHQEGESVARLKHPNIVTVHDADQAGATHFLVLELVEGIPLDRLVKEQGPLPVHRACVCVRQVAAGLQHAHEKGLVHRDIKPRNLMLTPDGLVKILDFGLARLVSESQADGLTQQGTVMGTPDYLAPEQAHNAHAADIRADIYSLGCTLYFLLSGQPPFPRGSVMEKLSAHLSTPPRPVHEVRPDVPPGLWRVLERMLAKKPQDRYQTPAEVAQALVPFLHPQPAKPPRRRRWLAWAAAPLLLLLAFAVYRISTDTGVVEIETDDPAVEVIVTRDGKRVDILDGKTKRRLVLHSGVYEFKLGEGDNELTLKTDRLVLKRGDREIVRVKREAAKAEPARPPALQGEGRERVPADELDREKVPPYEFAVAANGDAGNTLPELVAVLGDSRMKHWTVVECVAYSPDGKLVASGSRDHTIRFWDVQTGEQLALLEGHGASVQGLAFSPDGKTLASCSSSPPLFLWDVEKRCRKRILNGHIGGVSAVAFSPDGKTLASVSGAGHDRMARLWDTATWTQRLSWEPHPPAGVHLAAFSRDGTILATAGIHNQIKLWDPKDGKLIRSLSEPIPGGDVHPYLSFDPDGKTLLSCHNDGLARLWDVAKGVERTQVRISREGPVRGRFSHDGQIIAFACFDEDTVVVFDPTLERELRRIRGHHLEYRWVPVMDFSPDSKTLAFSSWDPTVKLWDIDTEAARPLPPDNMHQVQAVAVSPDGRWLASGGSQDGMVRLWDLTTGKLRYQRTQHKKGVVGLAFSPDGHLLASGSWDHTVILWDAGTGKPIHTLAGHQASVLGLSFHPDGKLLASCSDDRTVMLWDVKTGQDLATLRGHTGAVEAVAFSPDGQRLVSGGVDRTVRVWDPAARRELAQLRGQDAPITGHGIAVSRSGVVVSAANDGRVRAWDLASGEPIRTLDQHAAEISAVAVARDGRVATAAWDGTVRVCNPRTGATLRTLSIGPSGGCVADVAFTPEGRHLVTGNRNGTIYVLRLAEAGK